MKKYLLILLFYFLICGLYAQQVDIKTDYFTRFRNITVVDGLSNNRVLDIIQDSSGFIWIATQNGLNKYDGYNFKKFFTKLEDTTSLSGNYVTSLSIDNKNNLWIGTKEGLCRYIPQTETFYRFPVLSDTTSGISTNYVRKVIAEKNKQILWVETVDGILNKINLKTGSIKYIKHDACHQANTYDYHSIFIDNKNRVWFGGRFMGPYVFNDSTEKLIFIKADFHNLKKKRDNDIACIFQDSQSRLWMSATDGFYQYFDNSNTFKKQLATSTFDIIEGEQGYLWLATGKGLYKYNPATNKFIRYLYNQNDNLSLVNNHLHCLLFDKSNNLWIGTEKGLSIINRRENLFRHYRHIPETEGTLTGNNITCFLETKDHNIFIGTKTKGLNYWDNQQNLFDNFNSSFGKNNVSCLFEDRDNNIWVGMWTGRGFYKYNRKINTFTHYAYLYDSFKTDWYNDFYQDSKGRLWAGIWGAGGINFFNIKKGAFEPYNLLADEAPRYRINSFIFYNNYILITTKGQSIYRYNISSGKYQSFSTNGEEKVLPEIKNNVNITFFKSNPSYFKNIQQVGNSLFVESDNKIIEYNKGNFTEIKSQILNNIKNIFSINDSLLVIVTKQYLLQLKPKSGTSEILLKLNKQNISSGKFFKVGDKLLIVVTDKILMYDFNKKSIIDTKINISQDYAASINQIETDGVNTLFATNKGVVMYNAKANSILYFNIDNSIKKGLITNVILSIRYCNADKLFWVGTNKGLFKFNVKNSIFKQIKQTDNFIIQDINLTKKDTVWFLSGKHIGYYNILHDKAKLIDNLTKHELSSHLVSFIYEDSYGDVWVGTTKNGLNKIDTSTYEITHYLSNTDDYNALWGDNVSCITQLDDTTIVIGAEGLNIFNIKTGKFSHFTSKNGMPSDKILGVTKDIKKRLWVLTDKGLLMLNLRKNKFRFFAENWGLHTYEFNPALYLLSYNKILLATNKGFYSFNPDSILKFQLTSDIQFSGFKVFNKEIVTDFSDKNEIKLNYDENFFTILFSDLNYLSDKTTYLYKLKGVDKEWVTTFSNSASYTKISPGKYSFLVNTPENEKNNIIPRKLTIIITPPYWQTIWFYFLEILLMVIILLSIYFQRNKQFKLRENHLKLEQRLLRLQMNPHFLFNSLTAIQSFIFKNNPKEAGKYLSKFAKLMRLFLQNSREEFICLNREIDTLNYYMELQQLRFNNSFDYNITVSKNIDINLVKIPPMMTQPFIENAIEHGFKNIDYKGNINIDFNLRNSDMQISIQDNGWGIENIELKENLQKKHKSLATIITNERLKSFSNKKSSYSLQIIDLKDITDKKSGTKIVLNVPYKIE